MKRFFCRKTSILIIILFLFLICISYNTVFATSIFSLNDIKAGDTIRIKNNHIFFVYNNSSCIFIKDTLRKGDEFKVNKVVSYGKFEIEYKGNARKYIRISSFSLDDLENLTSTLKYKIQYNKNYGNGSMNDKIVNDTDKNVTLLDKNTFTRNNYNFTGWYAKNSDNKWYGTYKGNLGWYSKLKLDIGGNLYLFKDEEKITNQFPTDGQTITLYAQWENIAKLRSIHFNTEDKTIYVGDSYAIDATYKPSNADLSELEWISSNSSVATVKNGVVTAVGEGTALIHAKYKTIYSNVCVIKAVIKPVAVSSIKLNETSKNIYIGDSFNLIATINPNNATNKTIDWSSSNTKVATVNNGKVIGIGEGTAKITGKSYNGKTATCTVTVVPVPVKSIKLSESSKTLSIGNSFTLTVAFSPNNATNKTIDWSSSNTKVATVKNGTVTAVSEGSATITAKTSNGKTTTCTIKTITIPVESIELDKASRGMYVGKSFTLKATIYPENSSNKNITWTSSNTDVATVNNGKVTAKSLGKTTITAKTNNGKTATCEVTTYIAVTEVKLNKSNATIYTGDTLTLTPTVSPSNASNKKLTWTSSNTNVATVNNGKVTAVNEGTATITATSSNDKTATCTITVSLKLKPLSVSYNYYYNNLNETQKQLYLYLYNKKDTLLNGQEVKFEKYVTNLNNEQITTAIYALTSDYPEYNCILYYGYNCAFRYTGVKITSVIYSNQYLSATELRNRLNRTDAVVNSLIKNVNGKSNVDKIKYIHDCITLYMRYSMDLYPKQLPGVCGFDIGQGVCDDYARMFKYVMNKMNIDCIYVVGGISKPRDHAWNQVRINGKWYGVDCTWDDPGNNQSPINYTYFLKGSGTFGTRMLSYNYPALSSSNFQ